jgi:hypothetical protein
MGNPASLRRYRRDGGILTEQDAAEETASRLTFAKAYKPFFEKHHVAI